MKPQRKYRVGTASNDYFGGGGGGGGGGAGGLNRVYDMGGGRGLNRVYDIPTLKSKGMGHASTVP